MTGGAAVRGDLAEVFRRDYQRVVGVAARVLGSRDEAEDVAQEVFLAFNRSAVPAGEATGWLAVAAAHTALNTIRSGRRRASREEAVAATADTVAPDVAGSRRTADTRHQTGCPRRPMSAARQAGMMARAVEGGAG